MNNHPEILATYQHLMRLSQSIDTQKDISEAAQDALYSLFPGKDKEEEANLRYAKEESARKLRDMQREHEQLCYQLDFLTRQQNAYDLESFQQRHQAAIEANQACVAELRAIRQLLESRS